MPNRLFQVASLALALLVAAILVYAFFLSGSDDSGGKTATTATPATADGVVAALLRDVVQPETLGADARVIAFKLDAPLAAGTRLAPYLPEPLPQGVSETCKAGEILLDRPAWFFWVDDHPESLFAHPTRYVLIDPATAKVLSNVTQGWPPCVNGAMPSRWTDDAQRARPENQAYANLPQPRTQRADRLGETMVSFLAASGTAREAAGASQLPAEKPAVIAINGWSVGQTGKDSMDADAKKLRDFARNKGIPDAGKNIALGDPIAQIRSEIDRVVAGGKANSVLLLISAHGSIYPTGESIVSLGGTIVSRSQLDRLLAGYAAPTPDRPDGVIFSLAVAACRSADFKNMQATNVARVETCASSIQQACNGDFSGPDPGARWTKAVLDSVSKDPLFTKCVSCSLAAGAADASTLKNSTDFTPLFRDPVTRQYLACDPADTKCHPPATFGLPPAGTTTGASPTAGGGGSPSVATATAATGGPTTNPPTTGPAPPTVAPTAAPPTATPTSSTTTRTFTGSFNGSGEFRTADCGWRTVYSGTVELTLTFSGSSVTGTAHHRGGYSDTLISGPPECGGDNESFDVSVSVSGTAQSIRWSFAHGATGRVSVTGSLVGNGIVGQGIVTDASYSGSATVPFSAN